MFIGHFAVGLAGKKFAPSVSLASLWLAAIFADVLWPILIAVGAEEGFEGGEEDRRHAAGTLLAPVRGGEAR